MTKNSTGLILILTALTLSIAVNYHLSLKRNLKVISPDLSNSMGTVEVVAEIDTTYSAQLLSIEIFGGKDDDFFQVSIDNGKEYRTVKPNSKLILSFSKNTSHNVEINIIRSRSEWYLVRVLNIVLDRQEANSSNSVVLKHSSYNGSTFAMRFKDNLDS